MLASSCVLHCHQSRTFSYFLLLIIDEVSIEILVASDNVERVCFVQHKVQEEICSILRMLYVHDLFLSVVFTDDKRPMLGREISANHGQGLGYKSLRISENIVSQDEVLVGFSCHCGVRGCIT